MSKGFVQRQAEAYLAGTIRVKPWQAYANEVVEQWREIDHPIELVDSAITYLHPKELRKDILAGRPIKVWSGGKFDVSHPLAQYGFVGFPAGPHQSITKYQISRALHDYEVHYKLRYSFSPHDELLGALASRHDFSQWAQRAQWTDDVAMGCYYAHFGKWPPVQYPIVVEPDWDGLVEYLDGKEI